MNTTIIHPTVHLNGTHRDDLLEEYSDAVDAIQSALDALPNPNGRDYYPQGPSAIDAAIDQYGRWELKLKEVKRELEAIRNQIAGI